MESRRMVQTNLFAEWQWRRRQRRDLWAHCGREGVGRMERVAWKHRNDHMSNIYSGDLLHDSRRSNQCALWQPGVAGWSGRWEEDSSGRGRGHMYILADSLCGSNQHNSVKQLSFNEKINFKKVFKSSADGNSQLVKLVRWVRKQINVLHLSQQETCELICSFSN